MPNDSPPDSGNNQTHEVYNAAGKVAENIIKYFFLADWAMGEKDMQNWWIYLDKAYIQAEFSFSEKERDDMIKLGLLVTKNLYNSEYSYPLLKEYHLKLRRLCTKFFTMGESNTGPAIWRR